MAGGPPPSPGGAPRGGAAPRGAPLGGPRGGGPRARPGGSDMYLYLPTIFTTPFFYFFTGEGKNSLKTHF